MAEKVRPLCDGEFIKKCLTIYTEYACLVRKHLAKQTILSHFTVSRRANDPSDNIKETLKDRLKSCSTFCQALDESMDISDTVRLVIDISDAAQLVIDISDTARLVIDISDTAKLVIDISDTAQLVIDISDTARFVILIRADTVGLDVVEVI